MDARVGAQRAITHRNELGDSLFTSYLESNRVVAASFDRVGSDDWSKLCYRGTGSETLSNILNTFIVDTGVHRWDVVCPP